MDEALVLFERAFTRTEMIETVERVIGPLRDVLQGQVEVFWEGEVCRVSSGDSVLTLSPYEGGLEVKLRTTDPSLLGKIHQLLPDAHIIIQT